MKEEITELLIFIIAFAIGCGFIGFALVYGVLLATKLVQ